MFHFFFFFFGGFERQIKCLNPHPPGGLFGINFDRDIKPTFTTKLVWWCQFSTVHQHFCAFQCGFNDHFKFLQFKKKVKNAGVFNVQFTKENLRSYLPLTPYARRALGLYRRQSASLPALFVYTEACWHFSLFHQCSDARFYLPLFFLSSFLMFSTAAPSLCFQYFFDDSYFKLVGGDKRSHFT